jgi:hypothetical protein
LIALFCGHLTAWLPPLTILWTKRVHDVDALTPKIVKDGTPDQRAFLQARFPGLAFPNFRISICVNLRYLRFLLGGRVDI